jgi:hypothetical protein
MERLGCPFRAGQFPIGLNRHGLMGKSSLSCLKMAKECVWVITVCGPVTAAERLPLIGSGCLAVAGQLHIANPLHRRARQ